MNDRQQFLDILTPKLKNHAKTKWNIFKQPTIDSFEEAAKRIWRIAKYQEKRVFIKDELSAACSHTETIIETLIALEMQIDQIDEKYIDLKRRRNDAWYLKKTLAQKAIDLRNEIHDSLPISSKEIQHFDLGKKMKRPIAIIHASMKVWVFDLGWSEPPKTINETNKSILPYLDDVFEAFGEDVNIVRAYNNWGEIKKPQ